MPFYMSDLCIHRTSLLTLSDLQSYEDHFMELAIQYHFSVVRYDH